jgi:hypothetical protein
MPPRMVRVIEGLAGDWCRLDERIEGLSNDIETVARRDTSCERLMSVPGSGQSSRHRMKWSPTSIFDRCAYKFVIGETKRLLEHYPPENRRVSDVVPRWAFWI